MRDTLPGSGLRVAIGRSGAGKTHGIRNELHEAARGHLGPIEAVLALDAMGEWSGVPQDLARVTAIVRTVERGIALAQRGARLVIVQPDTSSDLRDVAEQACRWAWRRGATSVRGIAIPEAHRVAPQGNLSPAIQAVVTAWRHGRVACWLDTQRFALLNRTAIEQASETRLYAVGRRDRDQIVRDFGAPELGEALAQCAQRLKRGESGWHVKVDIAAEGPFRLERE